MAETSMRSETDSLGEVDVAADRYWGAQTERARHHFDIGSEPMPAGLIRALALIKRAAATVNHAAGRLDEDRASAIIQAADEIVDGRLDDHFPLRVWQSGSGTQSNMNVNEVIAGRANETLTGRKGGKSPVHPNDHVNMGQSSNDTVPTALHMAIVEALDQSLTPGLGALEEALDKAARKFRPLVKIGRTHMQDATPISLGDEFSGYAAQVEFCHGQVRQAREPLLELTLGGTAVGNGLNAPDGFAGAVIEEIARLTEQPFRPVDNRFAAQAGLDAVAAQSGALNTLAAALTKIANDIRLAGSGPRAGLGELILPANEPGSSIMPGKVNPTQVEAITMIAAQVMGNHLTVTLAAAGGQFELNAFKPVAALNMLQAIQLLGDGCRRFTDYCVSGLEADTARLEQLTQSSLMLVTALAPHIGYDKAAQIAKAAHEKGCSLKEAALETGEISEGDFDRWVDPAQMAGVRDG